MEPTQIEDGELPPFKTMRPSWSSSTAHRLQAQDPSGRPRTGNCKTRHVCIDGKIADESTFSQVGYPGPKGVSRGRQVGGEGVRECSEHCLLLILILTPFLIAKIIWVEAVLSFVTSPIEKYSRNLLNRPFFNAYHVPPQLETRFETECKMGQDEGKATTNRKIN